MLVYAQQLKADHEKGDNYCMEVEGTGKYYIEHGAFWYISKRY